jgi:hypothetical protein
MTTYLNVSLDNKDLQSQFQHIAFCKGLLISEFIYLYFSYCLQKNARTILANMHDYFFDTLKEEIRNQIEITNQTYFTAGKHRKLKEDII